MSEQLKKFLKDLGKGSDKERDWCKILKETIAQKSSELQNRESVRSFCSMFDIRTISLISACSWSSWRAR